MAHYKICYLCDKHVWVSKNIDIIDIFHCKICKLKIKHFGPLHYCDLNRNGECTTSKPCLHKVHDPILINGKYMFDNDVKGIAKKGKIGVREYGDRYYTCFSIIPLVKLGTINPDIPDEPG